MSEVETFITGQLDTKQIPWEIRRNFIHVSCCFHQHSGRQLLLGFSRTTGGMHCWSCHRKGHWNHYAERQGLQGFGQHDPRLHDIAALLRDDYADPRGPEQPQVIRPWPTDSWRGLGPEFLRGVPSYQWYDEASRGLRILWPVYCNDRFHGCTSARLDPGIQPKTRNLRGLDATSVLWPLDHPLVRGSDVVVLVEGQYDALSLLNWGIPAVSILGTGAWHPRKLRWLVTRGVSRLILGFDGDRAGRQLTEQVAHDHRDQFDQITPVWFPDGQDPGACEARVVQELFWAVSPGPPGHQATHTSPSPPRV